LVNRTALALVLCAVLSCVLSAAIPQTTETLLLRGHPQTLRLYGTRGRPPVIVTSGDGGWMHLGPHVAEKLAASGFFVVGFDARAYLESFTSGPTTLKPTDEPRDYKVLADFASRGTTLKPILIGVSEGAGLSVLAATDPATQGSIAGVIGLGLPDLNELGWRLKDMIIYITRGNPDEPMFSTQAIVNRVNPLPLAAIHSTKDEFVPLAEVQRVMAAAKAPKQLWIVKAADHRFSDNLEEFDRRLLEAIAWVNQNTPR
jgi:alpha-beta hydrolase superfamily lysophospholipase